MKKIILSALLLTSLNVNAQLSIDGGVKGSYNSTWLFNKNISDQGVEQDYAAGWGSNYGLGASVYYGSIGLGVDFLMGSHTGGYAGEYPLVGTYQSNVKLNMTQIPILLKFKSKVTGPYVELGAQFNTISKATYNRNYDNSSLLNVTDGEVSDEYSKSFTSAVLGFGINMRWSESLPLNIHAGLRLNYGFSDAKGVDAQGVSLSEKLVYPTYEKTNAVSGGILVGLTYVFEPKK
jgi:hypothetical protein